MDPTYAQQADDLYNKLTSFIGKKDRETLSGLFRQQRASQVRGLDVFYAELGDLEAVDMYVGGPFDWFVTGKGYQLLSLGPLEHAVHMGTFDDAVELGVLDAFVHFVDEYGVALDNLGVTLASVYKGFKETMHRLRGYMPLTDFYADPAINSHAFASSLTLDAYRTLQKESWAVYEKNVLFLANTSSLSDWVWDTVGGQAQVLRRVASDAGLGDEGKEGLSMLKDVHIAAGLPRSPLSQEEVVAAYAHAKAARGRPAADRR